MAIAAYEQTFRAVNHVFNFLGYIPLVSSISGPLRSYYGAIQTISAIALGIIAATGVIAALTAPGMPLIISGILVSGVFHVIRGYIETIPFAGNTVCVIYDIARFLL